ncbi:MAG: ATP-binding protein [Polyangiaceae bacterium]
MTDRRASQPPEISAPRPAKPRFPLASKFSLVIVTLLALLSIGASLSFYFESRSAARQALERQGDAIASTLGYSIEVFFDNKDLTSIQRIVSNSALLPDVRSVLVTDRAGTVMASSDRAEMGIEATSLPLRAFLKRGTFEPEMIYAEGGDVLILRPLRRGRYESIHDTGTIGAIQITVDRRSIEADAENGALRMLAIHLAGYLLLMLLAAVALRFIVVRPLYTITAAAARVGTGDRSARAGYRSKDEIGLVAESFDRMAEDVERGFETLEEKVRERTAALQQENEEKAAAFEALRRTQAETDRIKGDIISVVSHELRTPLTAIRGSIGLLTGGALGQVPPEQAELLVIAERNVLRLIELVNDILDMDRLERGMFEVRIEPTAIQAIFHRSVEAVADLAKGEHISIEVEPTSEHVRGDPSRLTQVLVNLLSNAIKFSPPESHVRVSACAALEEVEIRVEDEGPGIPEEHKDRIFDRFHQVQSPSTREKGGSGLGLSISQAIVHLHGGTIGVDSEEGHGSTFWFRVPRAEGPRAA